MADKGKVLAAINKKFEGKSVSKLTKEELATKWAEKIETDEEIDDFIDDREDVILVLIKEADTRVTETKGDVEEEDDDEGEDEFKGAPDYIKKIMANQKTLSEKLEKFETDKKETSLTERFKNHPDLKGIPEVMFKGRIPKTEEEFEAAVAELKTDAETLNISTIQSDTPGAAGGGGGIKKEKEASKEELDEVMSKL